eukprot:8359298-Ditylum_brightwellii.AAC.2
MRGFYLLYQQEHHTLEQYLETFLNNIDVIKHSDGNIGEQLRLANCIRLIEGDEDSTDAAVVKASLKKSTEAYLTYAFYQEQTGGSTPNCWRTSPMPF